MKNRPPRFQISIVIPLFNEAENIGTLFEELSAAMESVPSEFVFVDDGSIDGTAEVLAGLSLAHPEITLVSHPMNAGQSAALTTGIRAANAPLIATLDGDGQNDPADIPRLIQLWHEHAAEEKDLVLIAGNRASRQDSWSKRASSRIANHVRRWVLDDHCLDTGCSLKVFRRCDFLALPPFDHMHRFLPALFARDGIQVINSAVNHRPRLAGESKYGVGNRLWVGITDMLCVRWLAARQIRLPADFRLDPTKGDKDRL